MELWDWDYEWLDSLLFSFQSSPPTFNCFLISLNENELELTFEGELLLERLLLNALFLKILKSDFLFHI